LREGNNEHLFDLSIDPGEKAEMKTKHPEVFAKIKAEYQKWNAGVLPLPART